MKLFSSFDTGLKIKLLREAQQIRGKEKVFLSQRNRIFLFAYVLFPFLILCICLGLFNWSIWVISGIFNENILLWIFIVSNVLLISSFGSVIIKKWIDYKMDYAIITPDEIIFYNQSGFFDRDVRTIENEKIKTVKVSKHGLWKSLFNYGSLIVITEGDDSGTDIELYYVTDPDRTASKISSLIDINDFQR